MDKFETLFREIFTGAANDIVATARLRWEQENQFWTVAEVCEYARMSDTAFRELRDNPRKKFPKPVAFTTKPVWFAVEVLEWARQNRLAG